MYVDYFRAGCFQHGESICDRKEKQISLPFPGLRQWVLPPHTHHIIVQKSVWQPSTLSVYAEIWCIDKIISRVSICLPRCYTASTVLPLCSRSRWHGSKAAADGACAIFLLTTCFFSPLSSFCSSLSTRLVTSSTISLSFLPDAHFLQLTALFGLSRNNHRNLTTDPSHLKPSWSGETCERALWPVPPFHFVLLTSA